MDLDGEEVRIFMDGGDREVGDGSSDTVLLYYGTSTTSTNQTNRCQWLDCQPRCMNVPMTPELW